MVGLIHRCESKYNTSITQFLLRPNPKSISLNFMKWKILTLVEQTNHEGEALILSKLAPLSSSGLFLQLQVQRTHILKNKQTKKTERTLD